MKKQGIVLSAGGFLKIPEEFLPKNSSRNLSFFVRSYPAEKRLELEPLKNGEKGPWLRRKAVYSNSKAKTPILSVKVALKNIGVDLPKTIAIECKAEKKLNGTIVVSF